MTSNELPIVLIWKYIRQALFGRPNALANVANRHKETPVAQTAHLDPSARIRELETEYEKGSLTASGLDRYKADADFLMQHLDDFAGPELGQFLSEIYELNSLIERAEGNDEQAASDLNAALDLNPQGTWLVSRVARAWGQTKEKRLLTPPITKRVTISQSSNRAPTFRNVWTEDIKGWGYSPDSRFNEVRQHVFRRDNYRCVWCGSGRELTADHIRELRLGGTNEMSNLRTLCKDCHEKRHGRKIFYREFDADNDYGFDRKGNAKLIALVNAGDSGTGVCIEYTDRDGLKSVRTIHPIRIYKARYIFVNAYCELDKEQRVFRLSRMQITHANDNRYLNGTNTYTSSPWKGSIPFNTDSGQTIYMRPASSELRTFAR